MSVTWWCELAWLGGEAPTADVVVTADDGVITRVDLGVARPPRGSQRLSGLVLPGLANAHSHAFHRALRGLPLPADGTFWTWRKAMYAVAARLDPDRLLAIARATYAEMALAGVSCVGEFHYLHQRTDGKPYASANAMGEALMTAAEEAGIRLTLLDTCYLSAGFGEPVSGVQRRFADADADAWASRVSALRPPGHVRVGAAIHSVRAVPAAAAETVAGWARDNDAPLHVHVSEQLAENATCQEAYGLSPTAWLEERGALGASTTAVHGTHVDDDDIARLAGSSTGVCLCPTTEADLADGIGPFGRLRAAGVALSVGSDSQAVVDLLAEARSVEQFERLRTGIRGHWTTAELLTVATANGHAALGWPQAGRLAVGSPADLVAVDIASVRTAGGEPLSGALSSAAAIDVRQVVVGGRTIVKDGVHALLDDIPGRLGAAVAALRRTDP